MDARFLTCRTFQSTAGNMYGVSCKKSRTLNPRSFRFLPCRKFQSTAAGTCIVSVAKKQLVSHCHHLIEYSVGSSCSCNPITSESRHTGRKSRRPARENISKAYQARRGTTQGSASREILKRQYTNEHGTHTRAQRRAKHRCHDTKLKNNSQRLFTLFVCFRLVAWTLAPAAWKHKRHGSKNHSSRTSDGRLAVAPEILRTYVSSCSGSAPRPPHG